MLYHSSSSHCRESSGPSQLELREYCPGVRRDANNQVFYKRKSREKKKDGTPLVINLNQLKMQYKALPLSILAIEGKTRRGKIQSSLGTPLPNPLRLGTATFGKTADRVIPTVLLPISLAVKRGLLPSSTYLVSTFDNPKEEASTAQVRLSQIRKKLP